MARLPTFADLGRASVPSGRRVSDMDVTGRAQQIIAGSAGLPGKGLEAVGGGLQKLGDAGANIAFRQAAAEQEKADKIALNDAKTSWLLSSSNLEQTLKQETDPNRINQEFPDAIRKAAEASKEYLNDEQKAHFDEWVVPHLVDGLQSINQRSSALVKDRGRASADENIFRFQDIAKRQPTAEAAMRQLPNIAREIDNGVLKGYWSADDAAVRKNTLTKDVAHDWLDSQSDETKLSILRPVDAGANTRKIYDKFVSAGFSPEQSAGAAGAFVAESKLNPNAIARGDGSDGSDSIGIGQWNSDRAKALKAFAASRGKPWNDLDTQVDFAIQEMQTNEAKAGGLLKSARSVDEAAAAMLNYERPKGYEGGLGVAASGRARLRSARAIHGQFTGTGTAPDTRITEFIDPDKKRVMADAAEGRLRADDNRIATAMKEQIATQSAIEKVNTGVSINPYDTDGKKDLDRAYAGIVSSGVDPNAALIHIVDKTKALPPDAVRSVRQGLASNNPSEVSQTASSAFNLMTRGGNAVFAPYDGGDEIDRVATKYQHYTEYLGMDGVEAGKRLIQERDPAYKIPWGGG